MIHLLFTLLVAEVVAVAVLLFRTPLRKLALLGLDRLKRGRGPLVVKTVAATSLVVLSSSLYSIAKIRRRSAEVSSELIPTDQVLLSRHLLEASLMGYSLFLVLVIERLHHLIRELPGLRKCMDAVMNRNRVLEEAKRVRLDEMKARDGEIGCLNKQIKQLKLTLEEKVKEIKTAEVNAEALRKQYEGSLLVYDRLLEENQNLRRQVQSIDRHWSHSDRKKNA
ncbi:hypothetical protein Cni_G05997 [Canna indica]|uniref:Endoplasmic reticulum transmembrane protein n=1 Tax=Canna indica TaxID=4628 RepID=A0AAQ3JXV2_9LILI|nr:hypothetical protein Cni_G05997 [Canna indica]